MSTAVISLLEKSTRLIMNNRIIVFAFIPVIIGTLKWNFFIFRISFFFLIN